MMEGCKRMAYGLPGGGGPFIFDHGSLDRPFVREHRPWAKGKKKDTIKTLTNGNTTREVQARMKMELVQKELQGWANRRRHRCRSEVRAAPGDTEFDYENRVIRLQSVRSKYVIDGDAIESIELHLGGEED